MALSQQDILNRYQNGIQSGGSKWLQSIQAMTVNPAAAAASPQGMANWLSGVQASVGKRQASLARVSLQDIQQAAAQYGQTNYTNSAMKAASKYGKKLPALQSLWAAQRAAAAAIPKAHGTGNIARVQAVINLAIASKGKI